MDTTLVAVLKSLILPPGIFLIFFIFNMLIFFKRRRAFLYIHLATIFFFYLLSTPFLSQYLVSAIEPESSIDLNGLKDNSAEAIVVLGCSRYPSAPEYGYSDSVSACTLVRLRYAVILHKITQLPIILSGGSVFDEADAEAQLMGELLRKEYGVAPLWLEKTSKNTYENARQVIDILNANDFSSILLVTHAVHMLRAEYAFSLYDIDVIPAPTYFLSTEDARPYYFDYLPSINAFRISNMTMYEVLGYLWIKFKEL